MQPRCVAGRRLDASAFLLGSVRGALAPTGQRTMKRNIIGHVARAGHVQRERGSGNGRADGNSSGEIKSDHGAADVTVVGASCEEVFAFAVAVRRPSSVGLVQGIVFGRVEQHRGSRNASRGQKYDG